MKPKTLTAGGLTADVYLPKTADVHSVSYALTARRPSFSQLPELTAFHTALVVITGMDWSRDLPPWDAPPLYRGDAPFQGGADDFLSRLLTSVIPTIEKEYQLPKENPALIGVSLAGLFAAYAACRCDAFPRIASISGSLWYDGFTSFLTQNPPVPAIRAAYFSLGRKEKKVKNARLAAVETVTAQAAALFESRGIRTTFELNPGNHFTDGPLRLRKALAWLGEMADG